MKLQILNSSHRILDDLAEARTVFLAAEHEAKKIVTTAQHLVDTTLKEAFKEGLLKSSILVHDQFLDQLKIIETKKSIVKDIIYQILKIILEDVTMKELDILLSSSLNTRIELELEKYKLNSANQELIILLPEETNEDDLISLKNNYPAVQFNRDLNLTEGSFVIRNDAGEIIFDPKGHLSTILDNLNTLIDFNQIYSKLGIDESIN